MAEESLRLDKWLWFARFCKSRSRATQLCRTGHIRVNDIVIKKPSHPIVVGDTLILRRKSLRENEELILRVRALGNRRGPSPEAQALYKDLTPANSVEMTAARLTNRVAAREPGAGRPTKRERRVLDRWLDTQ